MFKACFARCRSEVEYFFAALGFFTRLPVPAWVGYHEGALAESARWFPAIGLIVGGIAALVFWLAAQCWPPAVAIVLSMAATVYVTGAFHEDGLSDTADGLGGGWEKTRILAIMKDSRVGSYGVVALWLALTGKLLVLQALSVTVLPLALLAGHAFSRFCATGVMAVLDYARDDASSKVRPVAARPGPFSLLLAGMTALLPLLALPVAQCASALLFAVLATLWLVHKFRRWLGGYTGDCLGAVQQVSEIAFYLGLGMAWR